MKRVTAFAPATVANVAVGFDILGFPVDGVGDEITLTKIKEPTVEIEDIRGRGAGDAGLPRDPSKNTATVGLQQLIKDLGLNYGFRVIVKKGIPLGSGMGGSAASSVGALVAANRFFGTPVPKERLLKYALMGERLASGAAHADNVSPCLFGGLTLTRSADPVDVISIPVPASIFCVLVHPHLRIDTRAARQVLKPDLPLPLHVKQSANIAGFIAGCYRNDLALVRRSLIDLVIEPQRASLLPSFNAVKAEALASGAMACSFSGSGPSLFAWADSSEIASRVEHSMVAAFKKGGVKADAWISKVSTTGARVLFQE